MSENEAYHFADLLLDVGRQRLTRDGTEVPLPRLSFNVLLALLRAAPNVVSTQQLLDEVWAGLVVNPETVIQRVKLLRDAIGDDPRSPRYISGLRGRGYQLACEVRRIPPATDMHGEKGPEESPTIAEPVAAAPVIAAPRHRWRIVGLVAAAVVLVAVAASLALRPADRPPSPKVDAAAALPNTVAVLPFDDLSADGSGEYIAVGVPETIRDRLASIEGLTVIAPASSFDPALAEVASTVAAEMLQARFLIDGSVQRQGNALRITARLVEASSGVQLWSSRFDRAVGDVFAVQEEIAERVAESLRARVGGLAALAAPPPTGTNLEAYLLFLEGRVRLGRWTITDAELAATQFERATVLDPGFATAHAWLYDARMMVAEHRREDLGEARRRNASLIERTLALDPGLGAAYYVRAIWGGDDDAARESDFRRGMELDPANGRGLLQYSRFLETRGRREEAARILERAATVDPLSPRVQFQLAMQSFGRHPAAELEALMRRVLEQDPNFHPALQRYAKYRWMFHGSLAEAAQIIERAIAVDPENPWSRYTAAVIYLDLDEPASAREVAEGTTESARAARVLLALRASDIAAAGAAALAGDSAQNRLTETWGESEAVRDVALETRDLQRSIRHLESRFRLSASPGLGITQFRAAAFQAQLLREDGQHARAQRLLDELPAAIDASLPIYDTVYALRTKASVLLLLGRRDEALATLAQSFRDGDYSQWWYVLDLDPQWKPLATDPRFQAIEREVRAHVAAERAKLLRLRADGALPPRGSAPTASRPKAGDS